MIRNSIFLLLGLFLVPLVPLVPLEGQEGQTPYPLLHGLPGVATADDLNEDPEVVARRQVMANARNWLNGEWFRLTTGYQKNDSTRIDSVGINHREKRIRVYADRQLAYFPAREATISYLETALSAGLPPQMEGYSLEIFSDRRNIRDYIPNYYRSDRRGLDRERLAGRLRRRPPPVVTGLSRPHLQESSLYNMNIALWHSHGWYYEPSLNRWEWQRARIFETVEDIYPMAFTLQFLVPMLENAGATVFMPRERDWQHNEVIVDNDGSTGNSIYRGSATETVAGTATPQPDNGLPSPGTGFAIGEPPYVDENPFTLGTSITLLQQREADDSVVWIPEIPEQGEYAVYVSYQASPGNATDAGYTVYHSGGVTRFSVNQQVGGGTWIYLGKFRFHPGLNPEQGRVVLTNRSGDRRAVVTADAVRFGGGMGNISRNGFTGSRPRYQEAARYYLQYAGFPDTLVWKLNTPVNDYRDDYQSRGEWVNYLVGAPSGPQVNRESPGLGIPVDLSLAFHTDAGITFGDTVIGTLGIYSTLRDRGLFPGGLSRMASRDLTDIIQTQIVEDIRAVYDREWVRRAMWDRDYSEAFRPNVPAMLLELFSHQNFIDIRFGHEPMFRFHVSRAIYKGMLKFLQSMYGIGYVVQPLPVDHFRTGFLPGGEVLLNWRGRQDPLEPTADPESYMVYTRINDGGYDNGQMVTDTFLVVPDLAGDSIYSFRVTAVNTGGESFPSEELSVCRVNDSKGRVLVVNAFDRTGGQAWFNDTEYAGFLHMVDQGVPYGVDLHTVGAQYDFRKSSPWLDDDSPGHGASYADLEQLVIPGNSFDFSYVHGQSIRNAGYSFVSVSDESLLEGNVDLSGFDVLDYLAGEEKTTFMPKDESHPLYQVFPGEMLEILDGYMAGGGGVFISGAHIASDVSRNGQDSLAAAVLKYKWRTSNASRTGRFHFMDSRFMPQTESFSFNTGYHPSVYTVEGADAIEPAAPEAFTLMRYSENNMSAGIASGGKNRVVALGFPFESMADPGERDLVMQKVLWFLTNKQGNE
jgi:hypothetical protein